MLIQREQYWIDFYDAKASGYNIAPKAGSQLGFRHSEESKRKMSVAQAGKKRSAEAIEKTAAALRGRPKSKEHAAKVGAAQKGKVVSEETRRKMSEARRGKARSPLSQETKTKISQAQLGKKKQKTGWSDERKAAMSAMMTGRKMPREAVEKTRLAQTGKHVSAQTRINMAEAAKNRPTTTEETRKKLSEAGKGRVFSEETKAKIAAAHLGKKGRPMSEEEKAIRSAKMKGRIWTPDEIARRVESRKKADQERRSKFAMQVATPIVEPAGRAQDGHAFQQ